jgi:hypothetical protein
MMHDGRQCPRSSLDAIPIYTYGKVYSSWPEIFFVRGQAVGKAAGGYLLPFEIVRV